MSARPSKLALLRHEQACARGQQGYMDPDTGYFVMTSVHLKAQGSCCGNGCRHCPWTPQQQDDAGRDANAPSYPWPPR